MEEQNNKILEETSELENVAVVNTEGGESKPSESDWTVGSVSEESLLGQKSKVPVTDEVFIRAWNKAETIKEAAAALDIQVPSVRARGAKLKKTFAKAGVDLKLRKHKPSPRKSRISLKDDADELARLANIAAESYPQEDKPETGTLE